MALTRTSVFVAQEDLDVIKAAAARQGVPEAALIRDAIHLAALAARTWEEPFFSGSFGRQSPADDRDYTGVVSDVRDAGVEAYQETAAQP